MKNKKTLLRIIYAHVQTDLLGEGKRHLADMVSCTRETYISCFRIQDRDVNDGNRPVVVQVLL